MRFVRYKTTTVKVSDQELHNLDAVRQLLVLIKDKALNCAMRLTNGPIFHVVRIEDISDETFNFTVYKPKGNLHKTSRLEEVAYLELNTDDDKIMNCKPNMTRWFMLGHVDESDLSDV